MSIWGRPNPLPECTHPDCGLPMRREDWVASGGKCSEHLSVAETLARVHNRHQLVRVAAEADRRAQRRIDALAAKRLTTRV